VRLPSPVQGAAFYHDRIHPDGLTGHRMLAELALHLLNSTVRALRAEDAAAALAPAAAAAPAAAKPAKGSGAAAAPAAAPPVLPPPMLPNNYESGSAACLVGAPFFTDAVKRQEGFQWLNEAKGLRLRPGYIATAPGAFLAIAVDTSAPEGAAARFAKVDLMFLTSYEHMGKAAVTCASGCTCAPSTLNGHTTARSSQVVVFPLNVSRSAACTLEVRVLPESDSGEHKVKITGLIIADADGGAVSNRAALDYASMLGARAKDGVVNILNHV
jgi:DNA polymerase alpha subunit B